MKSKYLVLPQELAVVNQQDFVAFVGRSWLLACALLALSLLVAL